MPDHRLDLPGDQWADIRDPRKMTRGARKPIRAAMLTLHRYRSDLQEWSTAVAEQEASAANPGIIGAIPLSDEVVAKEPCQTCEGIGTDEDGTPCTDCAGTGAVEPAEPMYLPNEAEIEMLDRMQEALTVALVADWSFTGGVSLATLNELPADAADALVEHCSTFVGDVFVYTEPTEDEASPTTP
jgi:hypothetical protein